MPNNQEEVYSQKLKKIKGQPEEIKDEPNIVRKDHPEKKKMVIYIIISAVIIAIIGSLGLYLQIKFNKTDTFSGKIREFTSSISSSWSDIKENVASGMNKETEEKKGKILSNPQNLSEDEIEKIENSVFSE